MRMREGGSFTYFGKQFFFMKFLRIQKKFDQRPYYGGWADGCGSSLITLHYSGS